MITVNTLTVCDECACLSKLMMQYWRPYRIIYLPTVSQRDNGIGHRVPLIFHTYHWNSKS